MMTIVMFSGYSDLGSRHHLKHVCKSTIHLCAGHVSSPGHGNRTSGFVKAHEFFGQMQTANQSFRLLDSNVGDDDNLLSGTIRKTEIRRGLTVQYSDLLNLCDLQTRTEAAPHLGIKLFFQGGIVASIGKLDIPMPVLQPKGNWLPSATLFHQKQPEVFSRRAGAGERMRKLSIKIMPEWLEQGDVFADASAGGLYRFMQQGLSARSWAPSGALLALADQLINPPHFEPHLKKLYMESRLLGIIAEAFGLLLDERSGNGHSPGDPSALSTTERKRLRRAEELLLNSRALPAVKTIAADVGVSVNTLQRLFQAGHGTSVFQYVRDQKLEQARLALEEEGLSVAQAAYIGGYTSAANFSTAFKRRFGFSPKQARR